MEYEKQVHGAGPNRCGIKTTWPSQKTTALTAATKAARVYDRIVRGESEADLFGVLLKDNDPSRW